MPNSSIPQASAYYSATLADFRATSAAEVLGMLTAASDFDVDMAQRDAWLWQIELLRDSVGDLDGMLYLEFDVPRLGSRIDGVIVSDAMVVPIEFKIGESRIHRADVNQAWDYALDLKNFHEASRDVCIYPVLCATNATVAGNEWQGAHEDGVYPPLRCNATTLRDALQAAARHDTPGRLDPDAWGRARYRPSPTIVEAARALYSRHSVDAIARNDAGAQNLAVTSGLVEQIIERARDRREKAIVFVTGVPGAGKTLVGLNVATHRRFEGDETHAVFLSGNGPLVAVLREALVTDEVARVERVTGTRPRKGEVAQRVKAFIQNVHHFRDEGVRDGQRPPVDHVVIFDEAQRAWNRAKTRQFMQQRKQIRDFDMSEPEFLLSYMDRHRDWAVVVCLVGGGQEIHTGEAGIAEWLTAVYAQFPHWRAYISSELHDSEYAAGQAIQMLAGHPNVRVENDLHLATTMRSFRSKQVAGFVKAMLDSDVDGARELLTAVRERYPIVLTRDRAAAKRWLKQQARGSERYGLVASSQAQRLKAYCIDVRVKVDPVKYFLARETDTRSSFFLEDAATEFQTQGLELDWVCVSWDADFRRARGRWSHHMFRGSQWVNVKDVDRQRYLTNAYRVLLTRARQGMVIFVPPGRKSDATIEPSYYDETYEYLSSIGVPTL